MIFLVAYYSYNTFYFVIKVVYQCEINVITTNTKFILYYEERKDQCLKRDEYHFPVML